MVLDINGMNMRGANHDFSVGVLRGELQPGDNSEQEIGHCTTTWSDYVTMCSDCTMTG